MSFIIEKVLPLLWRRKEPVLSGLSQECIDVIADKMAASLDIPVVPETDSSVSDESLACFTVDGKPVQTTWYFGFGSNLNPSVFEGRRTMRPIQCYPAELPGYQLCFDLPAIPYFEPVMGNIKEASDPHTPHVHGCCYRVTFEQLDFLHQTEGGKAAYQMEQVKVRLYTSASDHATRNLVEVQAYTCVYPKTKCLDPSLLEPQGTLPSARYVNLIRQGAKARGLDNDYVQYLDSLPTSKVPTTLSKAILLGLLPSLSALLAPFSLAYWFLLSSVWKLEPGYQVSNVILRFQIEILWKLWWLIPHSVRGWMLSP